MIRPGRVIPSRVAADVSRRLRASLHRLRTSALPIVQCGLAAGGAWLVAFNLIEDLTLKQSLLADGDVAGRIARTLDALAGLHPSVPSAYFRMSTNPSTN